MRAVGEFRVFKSGEGAAESAEPQRGVARGGGGAGRLIHGGSS